MQTAPGQTARFRVFVVLLLALWTVTAVHVGGYHHHEPGDFEEQDCPLALVVAARTLLPEAAPVFLPPITADALPPTPEDSRLPQWHGSSNLFLRGPPSIG